MIKIRYSILASLLFALIMFIYLSITSKIGIAIFVSLFILFVSPFIFYIKIFRKVDFDSKFQKIDKNSVIYSGISSHFKDGITVGGTLYLMNDRIIFQTNLINFIKRYEKTILLNQIAEVYTDDTFGIINNGLIIKFQNNENEKFVVNKRENWKEQIEEQKSKLYRKKNGSLIPLILPPPLKLNFTKLQKNNRINFSDIKSNNSIVTLSL